MSLRAIFLSVFDISGLKSLCAKKQTVRKDLGCKIFDPKRFSALKIVQNLELSWVKIKMTVETRMKHGKIWLDGA